MKPSTRAVTTELDAAMAALDAQCLRSAVALADISNRLTVAGQGLAARRVSLCAGELLRLTANVNREIDRAAKPR